MRFYKGQKVKLINYFPNLRFHKPGDIATIVAVYGNWLEVKWDDNYMNGEYQKARFVSTKDTQLQFAFMNE